jgi:hypothetical protein
MSDLIADNNMIGGVKLLDRGLGMYLQVKKGQVGRRFVKA